MVCVPEFDGSKWDRGDVRSCVGRASRAEALLEQSVASYGERHARNRALYRVRLARARLETGAVDGSAEAANVTLADLTAELASWRVSSELDEVARRLAEYPAVTGVERFLADYDALSTS